MSFDSVATSHIPALCVGGYIIMYHSLGGRVLLLANALGHSHSGTSIYNFPGKLFMQTAL